MTSQTPPQAPGPQAVPPGGPGVASFFDRIRSFGIVRPDDGRWAAGVAAGLARRWGVDPLLVRGGFVLLALFAGVGLLLYGLCWLFLPHPDGRIHAQEVLRGTVTAGFVGGLLSVLADLGGSGWRHDEWYGPQPFGGGLVLVALVGLAVWWFTTGRHKGGPQGPGGPGGFGGPGGPGGPGGTWTPTSPATGPATGPVTDPTAPPPAAPTGDTASGTTGGATGGSDGPQGSGSSPVLSASGTGPTATLTTLPSYGTPPPAPTATLVPAPPTQVWTPPRPDLTRPSHALTRVVLGGALLAAAAALVVDRATNLEAAGGVVAAAVALGVVSLGILVAGALGRRAGGLAPIGVLLAIVALVGAASTTTVTWAGDRTWTPGTVTDGTQYTLGIGEGRLDLSGVSAPGARAADPVEIDVRVGVGALTVVVPRDVDVRVIADAGNGEVRNLAGLAPTPASAPGPAREEGRADLDVSSGPDPTVLVHADLGVGQLTLVQSS